MKIFDQLAVAMKNRDYINDIISNNLANANTGGFKKLLTSISSKNSEVEPIVGSRIDDSPGTVSETNNRLDLSIDGNGYFCVQTAQGIRYTKNGCFKLNYKDELVTQSNDNVIGKNGPIVIRGNMVQVKNNGDIYVDGLQKDTLRIVSFGADKASMQDGSSYLSCPPGAVADKFVGRVRQFTLEGSNVSTLKEMVSMIENLRIYQTFGKMVQAQDELYAKIVALNSR